jgi:c-di-GMP-binding flagellar brake protein YcgR
MSGVERRRTERHSVSAGVTAQIVGLDIPVTLVNIGVGGFAIASEKQLPADSRLEARFADAAGQWTTTLNARVAYSVSQPVQDGEYRGKYITGFAFVDAEIPAVKRQIREFIAAVALVPA